MRSPFPSEPTRGSMLARRGPRAVAAATLTTAMLGLPLAQAATVAADPPPASAGPATLSVEVKLTKMRIVGRQAKATGIARASLISTQGTKTVGLSKVSLSAATGGGSCQVLHLYLQQLDLNLLGLVAKLDKVNLDVTGHARGGVLGQLFCRLSRGVSGKLASARATRALDARLAQDPPVLHFKAKLLPATAVASQAPAGTCQVLDLVLGPLNLTLLGLEVNLNQIHLNVTANPNGGVLGSLFCRLATAKLA